MPYNKPDRYTKLARAQGYAARSVFKLGEIAGKIALPRGGAAVDLGCSPGSWSMWLGEHGFRVVGVDVTPGPWLVRSVMEVTPEELRAALGGPADLVVSDMAPNTSGDRFTDHCRQLELASRALELCAVLKPGGAFVVKVFDGEDAPAFVDRVRQEFVLVKRMKPEATRDRSVEFFLAATGYRPTPGSRSTA